MRVKIAIVRVRNLQYLISNLLNDSPDDFSGFMENSLLVPVDVHLLEGSGDSKIKN